MLSVFATSVPVERVYLWPVAVLPSLLILPSEDISWGRHFNVTPAYVRTSSFSSRTEPIHIVSSYIERNTI